MTNRTRHSFREERRARADRKVADLTPVIAELQAAGITSLRGIAAAFNNRGIPAATGQGVWDATQVSRVLKRLPA